MNTKEIEVQILGKNFNFNVPEAIGPGQFLEIVDFVENKYSKIKHEAEDLDSFKLGLLVSINIAEEFFSIKKENEKLRTVLSHIDRMISPVEQDEKRMTIHFSS
ncbi:MAG: cell division protein ZapA [Candidatus Omnitrophota bacterium]